MGKKIKYFEALRGIAIIMVIGAHTYFYTPYNLFIRQIINCCVPLFYAMSGYFLYKKLLETKEQRITFWKKQIPKVYIPVLIWSLPFFFKGIVHTNILKSFFYLFTCGYSIYYFIAVIIQFSQLLPLLQRYRVGNSFVGEAISYVASFSTVGFIMYVYVIEGINLRHITREGFCLFGLCFFVIGCRLSQSDRKYSLFLPVIISVIGLIASYFESVYLLSNYGRGAGYKTTAFIFCIGMCYLLMSARMEKLYDNANDKIANILEYLGRNSFVLYLIHIHVVKYIHEVLDITHSWTLFFLIVLILSIVLIEIVKKIIPSKVQYYLGIY